MFKAHSIAALAALLAFTQNQCTGSGEEAPRSRLVEIRIVPKESTPEPEYARIEVLAPTSEEVETSLPVHGKIRVSGFPLGVMSEFSRSEEIASFSLGQHIRVFVDDYPPIIVDESAVVSSLEDADLYFQETGSFPIKLPLKPGAHIIRAFPVRSFNESLKGPLCYAAHMFYYQKPTNGLQISMKDPYLTYNEPIGTFAAKKPILLDFFIANCQLSADGYRVKVTIDDVFQQKLDAWQPYYVYGLQRGTHKIRLELIDGMGNPLRGTFVDAQRTIKVE